MDENAPNRCQYSNQDGQCPYQAAEGQKYCPYHLRNRDYEDQQALRAYILTDPKFAGSVDRHTSIDQLKSLREEIALCRAMIERRLNMVENNAEFLSAYGAVNTSLLTLERLVTSCRRLEIGLGDLLSKEAILSIAKETVMILMDELRDLPNCEEIVDRVCDKLLATIAKQKDE